ncbi:MAG: Spx/MgsR family RNA polymerase-binding regulatory protein [Turicibacter sp.]
MIEIYTSPNCTSSRKAKNWFKEHDIKFVEKNIFTSSINRNDLKKMLERTENGFEDIISTRSKAFKEYQSKIDEMSMNELLDLIIEHPSILKRPIIIDKSRFQVGYNDEEIRSFLPRSMRNTHACHDCEECTCTYIKALEHAMNDNFIEIVSA